jgi:hypothetical protein
MSEELESSQIEKAEHFFDLQDTKQLIEDKELELERVINKRDHRAIAKIQLEIVALRDRMHALDPSATPAEKAMLLDDEADKLNKRLHETRH